MPTVKPYVFFERAASLPDFKNLRNLTPSPSSRSSSSGPSPLPNELEPRVEALEALVRTLAANQDRLQLELDRRSSSRSTHGSQSIATGPPPSPELSHNSPRDMYGYPARSRSIFRPQSSYEPGRSPTMGFGYEHIGPSGHPSPQPIDYRFPDIKPENEEPILPGTAHESPDAPSNVDQFMSTMIDMDIGESHQTLNSLGLDLGSDIGRSVADTLADLPPADAAQGFGLQNSSTGAGGGFLQTSGPQDSGVPSIVVIPVLDTSDGTAAVDSTPDAPNSLSTSTGDLQEMSNAGVRTGSAPPPSIGPPSLGATINAATAACSEEGVPEKDMSDEEAVKDLAVGMAGGPA